MVHSIFYCQFTNLNSSAPKQNNSISSVNGSSSGHLQSFSPSSNVNVLQNIIVSEAIVDSGIHNTAEVNTEDAEEFFMLDDQVVTANQLARMGYAKPIGGDNNNIVWELRSEAAGNPTATTDTSDTSNSITTLLHSLLYKVSKMEMEQKIRLDRMELNIETILKIILPGGGNTGKKAIPDATPAVERPFDKITTVDGVKLFDCKLADETYFCQMVLYECSFFLVLKISKSKLLSAFFAGIAFKTHVHCRIITIGHRHRIHSCR